MNLNRIITFIVTLLVFFSSLEQSSAAISLQYKDGALIGLPKKYGKVTFDFKTTTLRIKDKEVVLPQSLRKLFMGKPSAIDTTKTAKEQEVIRPFEYFFLYSDSTTTIQEGIKPTIEIQIHTSKQGPSYGIVIDIDKMTITKAAVYHVEVGFIPLKISPESKQ